jgi:feruloyl esterase
MEGSPLRAETITTGSFTPTGSTNAIQDLPPFCRVTATLRPTADSEIAVEVWLPLQRWNGKFAGVGNGGWAGRISYALLGDQLRRGYATASTDTGHVAAPGEDAARFARDHPERLIDFAHRAHHETATMTKSVIAAFYDQAPARSYFVGCSSGGYEGLMLAQRYPNDYEGIVAGAPANNWTRLMAGDLDGAIATLRNPDSYLTPTALGLLHRTMLASCDASDGVTDGVLDDPRQCQVDPGTLVCGSGTTGDGCLTRPQADAARRVYTGLTHPQTGARLYPGLARGSEPYWPHRDRARPFSIPVSHYKWLVFGTADWDWRTFDFRDAADFAAHTAAESRLAPLMNATSADLRAFRSRGGKLLQYHGWNDELIAPQNSIDYYDSVRAFFTKDDVGAFYRLFMAPGMAHCSGGNGPNTANWLEALETWVEKGVAPERIVATRSVNGIVDRLRPLCPYPQVAKYTGRGDTNDATNFVCRAPGDATSGEHL